MSGIVVWWIKRDLRLTDNAALARARLLADEHHAALVPLYIREPVVTEAPDWSEFHKQAVEEGLGSLAASLGRVGRRLVACSGDAVSIFGRLHAGPGIASIVAHEETGPLHTFRRDRTVRAWARAKGVPFLELPTNGVIRGLDDRDRRIRIFHARMGEPVIPAPQELPSSPAASRLVTQALADAVVDPASLTNAAISNAPHPGDRSWLDLRPETSNDWTPGNIVQTVSEAEAQRTLKSFLNARVETYSRDISAVARAAKSCSRLSIHLAWGTITTKQILSALSRRREEISGDRSDAAKAMRKGLNAFRSRIYWHDHFVQRLEDEPDMELHPLNRAMESLPYKDNESLFTAWYEGRTGYPMVDASMRYFHATGWLNFRMRAMLVSFACHVLHLSWKKILWPMARLMADYVPGIHLSQTQMQAGVIGINTIRIYSPMKQLKDHDPECSFVREWVPELSETDSELIHAHETSPVPGYAPMVVPYKERTAVMRSALWSVKKSEYGRSEARRVLEKHGSRRRGGARR